MSDPLFRDEAVRWARGTRPGDPMRLDTRRSTLLFRLLLGLIVVIALTTVLVRVPASVAGSGVVDPAAGRFVTTLGPPVAVPGAAVTVVPDGGEPFESTLEPSAVGLAGSAPTGPGPERAARVEVHAGTEPLGAALLDAFSADSGDTGEAP